MYVELISVAVLMVTPENVSEESRSGTYFPSAALFTPKIACPEVNVFPNGFVKVTVAPTVAVP